MGNIDWIKEIIKRHQHKKALKIDLMSEKIPLKASLGNFTESQIEESSSFMDFLIKYGNLKDKDIIKLVTSDLIKLNQDKLIINPAVSALKMKNLESASELLTSGIIFQEKDKAILENDLKLLKLLAKQAADFEKLAEIIAKSPQGATWVKEWREIRSSPQFNPVEIETTLNGSDFTKVPVSVEIDPSEFAWQDPTGLIWGDLVKDDAGNIIQKNHREASTYCEARGGRLPTRVDYERLIGYMKNTKGTYQSQIAPHFGINRWVWSGAVDEQNDDFAYGFHGLIGKIDYDLRDNSKAFRCVFGGS